MKHRESSIFIALLLCILPMVVKAEVLVGDTLGKSFAISPYKVSVGGGLVLAGSLLDFDHGGRQLGENCPSAFSYKADEVLRFVPAVALVGMKAFGMESRTERWSELIVRSVASTAIMGVSVEGTKRLVGRVRPDGSDDRSFPSGHSATAFLTASLFAKEYGHLSPWYSVGAYGVATSTAMLRRVNNHHWMGDVMVGAGIGILSAELGYALADMFYASSDNKRRLRGPYPWLEQPSSMAGVYMKYLLPDAIEGVCGDLRVRSLFGYSAGMEASHFFNPYLGFGGRLGITSSQIEVEGKVAESPLDHVTFMVGPQFRTPLLGCFYAGIHIHGGYGFYPFTEVPLSVEKTLLLGGEKGWGYEGGLSITYLTRKDVFLNLVADYQSWSTPSEGIDNQGLSIGLSASWSW
ncbi:MAG: phosphatase PAP2 family protein [Bacteroidaceae bacterium]|nr:phosphatase PAP2 family protein [Bacteroidaceae bacterium]